jgi:hypothetical protein
LPIMADEQRQRSPLNTKWRPKTGSSYISLQRRGPRFTLFSI